MNVADALFACVLFYSLVLGARRGLYKEIIQFVALVVAVVVARATTAQSGEWVHGQTNGALPKFASECLGVIGVWVVTFFAVAVIGRLILKSLRGEGVTDQLGQGAEDVADALGGETGQGPVTLLTNPIAGKNGLFYWIDKLFGGALGLFKGAVTGYLLLGLVIYVDSLRSWESVFAKAAKSSYAVQVFNENLEPLLKEVPEYKIATSLGDMKAIATTLKETKDPQRFELLVKDPRLSELRKNERILELAEDEEILKAWKERDVKTLLANDKVREVLADREVRKQLAAVDWETLRKEIEAGPAKGAAKQTPGQPRDPEEEGEEEPRRKPSPLEKADRLPTPEGVQPRKRTPPKAEGDDFDVPDELRDE